MKFNPRILIILIIFTLFRIQVVYSNDFLFEENEKSFFNQNNIIKIYTDDSYPPLDFLDDNNVLNGMVYDYFEFFSKMTGLKFEYYYNKNFSEVIKGIKNKEYDIIPAVAISEERMEYLDFTDPFVEFPAMLFSSKNHYFPVNIDNMKDNQLIVVRNYSTDHYLNKKYPDKKVIRVNTIDEGLRMALIYHDKYFFGNLATALYYIEHNGYSKISIAGESDFKLVLRFGVRKDAKEIVTLINRCIELMPRDVKKEIYKKWVSHVYNVYNYYFKIFTIVSIVLILIMIVLYLFNYKLKKIVIIRTRELNSLKNKMKYIIDYMPSIVLNFDDNKLILFNNSGKIFFENINILLKANMTVEEVLKVNFREIYDVFHKVKENNKSEFIRKYYFTKNKTQRIFNIFIYPIKNNNHQLVIKFDDITQNINMENIIAHNEKMMSLGGLAAGMAHEINNPLSGINQSLQNIRRRLTIENSGNKQAAEETGITMDQLKKYFKLRKIDFFIQGAEKSSERASYIVNNILNFSRKSSTEFSEILIDELVNNSIKIAKIDYDLKKKYDFKHIKIKINSKVQNMRLRCIIIDIEQVLLNLLKNTAQAISEAEIDNPSIWIDLYLDKDMYIIKVKDNGPGIPEDIKNRIFEPFFTTKEVGVGTGLGLSISYYIIVDKHGGSLSVESEIGKGTEFTIKLPVNQNHKI